MNYVFVLLELEVCSTFGRVEGKYLQLDGSSCSCRNEKENSKYYFKPRGRETVVPNV
jgi:hypothetical protein